MGAARTLHRASLSGRGERHRQLRGVGNAERQQRGMRKPSLGQGLQAAGVYDGQNRYNNNHLWRER